MFKHDGEKIRRVIDVFHKNGVPDEWLVKSIELVEPNLKCLQEIWQVPSDNPMYDVWDVSPQQAKILKNEGMLVEDLDFVRFDYQLGAVRK